MSTVMSDAMLGLVRAVAGSDLPAARARARQVLSEDGSKKNAWSVKALQKALGDAESPLTPPQEISWALRVEDVTGYAEARHYLMQPEERSCLEQISLMDATAPAMARLGLPYANSVLLHGPSGSGKTMFARAVAESFGRPFALVALDGVVDALMGKTARTIGRIFDWAAGQRVVLMLDELDAFTDDRRAAGGQAADKERSHITTALMQKMDQMPPTVVLVAASNVAGGLDPALRRRFTLKHEMRSLAAQELPGLGRQILADLGAPAAWADEPDVREGMSNAEYVAALSRCVAGHLQAGDLEAPGDAAPEEGER